MTIGLITDNMICYAHKLRASRRLTNNKIEFPSSHKFVYRPTSISHSLNWKSEKNGARCISDCAWKNT